MAELRQISLLKNKVAISMHRWIKGLLIRNRPQASTVSPECTRPPWNGQNGGVKVILISMQTKIAWSCFFWGTLTLALIPLYNVHDRIITDWYISWVPQRRMGASQRKNGKFENTLSWRLRGHPCFQVHDNHWKAMVIANWISKVKHLEYLM
jgi:hypothetical protein